MQAFLEWLEGLREEALEAVTEETAGDDVAWGTAIGTVTLIDAIFEYVGVDVAAPPG